MCMDCHPKYIRMGCQREGGVRKGGGGEDGVCMQGKKVKVGWGARLWMEYSIFWLAHLHKVKQRMYPIWSQGRRQVVPMNWFNFLESEFS